MTFLCPVETCTFGANGKRYVGGTEEARAAHIKKRHNAELRPLPVAPAFQPIPATAGMRAAIYLRVSTIDQHPENQLPEIKRFLALKGWTVEGSWDPATDECTGHVYVDRRSGKNLDRPQLQRMLADSVASNRAPFNVVVFRRLNRLGRSLRDNIGLFDHFQSIGVALVSTEESYDTTTPIGRFVRNMMASMAEYQREEMLEMAREGIERRRQEGKHLGRHPWGCGVPVELGGLGPCPDGVQHKGLDRSMLANVAKREKWRKEKREARARARAQKDQRTNPLASAGDLSERTQPATGGV